VDLISHEGSSSLAGRRSLSPRDRISAGQLAGDSPWQNSFAVQSREKGHEVRV